MWASQQLLAIGKKSCVPRLSDNDAIAIVLKQDPPSNLASSLESGRIKSSIAGKKRLAGRNVRNGNRAQWGSLSAKGNFGRKK